jgi:thiol-disulfide isomerase/thioredoxin
MKTLTSVILSLLLATAVFAQPNANEIITKIKAGQRSIQTLMYELTRADTLLSGDTRVMHGRAWVTTDTADKPFGFKFIAQRDGINERTIYDGHGVYQLFDDNKTYDLQTDSSYFPHALGFPGGQIILKDLVRLDTTGTAASTVSEEGGRILLKLDLVDLKEYDVFKRSKTIEVDTSTWLPAAVRFHQEYLGKVQDLYYKVTASHLNDTALVYDFEAMPFLNEYAHRIRESKTSSSELMHQRAPAFILTGFNNQRISSADFKNQPVLLDFWEVWCGPCIKSMPEVQRLYDAYKNRGLLVYGIINEQKSISSAKLLVQKKEISFPTLIGNEKLRADYHVKSIPRYVLVDRTGKIVLVSDGYSDKIEAAIVATLGEK